MISQEALSQFAAVIPSLHPNKTLNRVVSELSAAGFLHIIVVDDGSGDAYRSFFDEAALTPGCTVLRHEVNKGKGAALKNAFRYIMEQFSGLRGVVTLDSDGQHLTKDVLACCETALEAPGELVLGCRNFNGDDVPFRSKLGNKFTAGLLRFCCGIKLSDTQTGLRVIPFEQLSFFSGLEGERFDFETNALLYAHRKHIPFREVVITTVYDESDGGHVSHYQTVRDSLRVAKLLLKFICSSLLSTLVDQLSFYAFCKIGSRFFLLSTISPVCTILARAISSCVNYNLNRKAVFNEKNYAGNTLLRYYMLCIPITLTSAFLIWLVTTLLGDVRPFIATLLKLLIDSLLFFVSYRIQRDWVYKAK